MVPEVPTVAVALTLVSHNLAIETLVGWPPARVPPVLLKSTVVFVPSAKATKKLGAPVKPVSGAVPPTDLTNVTGVAVVAGGVTAMILNLTIGLPRSAPVPTVTELIS